MAEGDGAPVAVKPLQWNGVLPMPRERDRGERLVGLEGVDLVDGQPARASTRSVAGMGPSSIIIGSSPITENAWKRACGRTPSSSARSADMISAAAAPSVTGEEFPAVMSQVSSGKRAAISGERKADRSVESPSTSVLGRSVSSVVAVTRAPSSAGVSTASSCASNVPLACAFAARLCDRTAKASISARSRPYRAAMRSAATPWLISPSGYRACTSGPRGSRPAWGKGMGTRLIDSTPQAMTTS